MADVTLFKPARYERTRQYRARRELFAYLRSRWDVRNFDYTIELKTGVLILDMKKNYRMRDVVDFGCYLYEQKPAANDA